MPRKERREMRLHRDRTDTRSAAAVRDAKRLVQVEMRHVGAEVPRRGKPDHRVQIRAVDVHLAAGAVHDLANTLDAFLEDAVRRRIGDHDRRELARVRGGLRLEVGQVDVAVRIAADDHHVHSRHLRRRGIRAVRGRGNEAHVAVRLVAARVIRADHEQARVLPLRTRVGLQRHGIVAGDRAQHLLELANHAAIARRLLRGRERMQRAELGPGHRNHLGRRVELHRARTERNHRAVERQVAVGQAAQIPEHFRFRAVTMEDRVREKWRRADERGRQRVVRLRVEVGDGEWRVAGVEDLPDTLDVLPRRRLVQRDAERRLVDAAEVEAMRDAVVDDALRSGAGRHGDRVEVIPRRHGEAEPLETGLEDRGEPMHAPRDRRQSLPVRGTRRTCSR